MTTIADPAIVVAPTPAAAPPARPRAGRTWARVVLACALLAASGAVRLWQTRQVDLEMEKGRTAPFDLKTLPEALGPWRTTSERVLDPLVVRNTGSFDSLSRTYVDERTGVQLGVLILYGSALDMHIHAPELCYPSAGYRFAENPLPRTVEYDGAGRRHRADTLAMVFVKGEGPAAERKQVYYAWGINGRWTPRLPGPKVLSRVPGMFKVHIDRRCAPGEALDADNPSESFLRELLPEMERRMAAAPSPSPFSSPGAPRAAAR